MQNRVPLALGFSLVLFAPLVRAQSGPAFVRDHVYGPGGGVVMTAEPDTIPPSAPPHLTGSSDGSNDVTLNWNPASDIGSGVAGYNVYRSGTYLGSTDGTSYSDYYCPTHGGGVPYHVYAYDQAGNVGPASTVSVTLSTCRFVPIKPPLGVSFISRPGASGAAGPSGTGNLVAYLHWLARRGEFSFVTPARTASGGAAGSSPGGSR